MPVHPSLQRAIAESGHLAVQLDTLHNFTPLLNANSSTKSLHVGYLSHDFNNHPTSHLIEGLFHYHDRKEVKVSAFGYGKGRQHCALLHRKRRFHVLDDQSIYRKQMMTKCDHFYDLAQYGYDYIADLIVEKKVQILLDVQGITLGTCTLVSFCLANIY